MRVKATRPVWVTSQDGPKRLLKRNESADVDGRKYKGHAFIKAGYLVEQPDSKPKAKAQPKAETEKVEQATEPEE